MNVALPRVAVLSTYVPRRCGLATFAQDVVTALREQAYVPAVVAVNDPHGRHDYGPEVCLEIDQDEGHDYLALAEKLNDGPFDVVSVQHEYGVFGGRNGSHLLVLLKRVRKPVVTTLHTLLRDPTPGQRAVLMEVCRRSTLVVVMSERAKIWLEELYDVPGAGIRVIPHGAPDVPFLETEPAKEQLDLSGRPTILTFGLLAPGKGIEIALEALCRIVPEFPRALYTLVGVTHPAVVRRSGERYRQSLETLVSSLGIRDNVRFVNRYVSLSELRQYLLASDVYVTPYASREQIVSGTLTYALVTGRAIVSTPYWYAQELLANGRGLLFDFGDVDHLTRQLRALLRDEEYREHVRLSAYAYGRGMIWSAAGRRYAEAFTEARHHRPAAGTLLQATT
jgi:glycosyltransferase involved in cell wall biosynthesis